MSELNAVFARSRKGALVISRGASIVGALTLEGDIFIEGTVEGEVRCTTLQITERGMVDGLIVADRVIVLGEVNGDIYANELILGAGCAVEGTINHNKLLLEKGCYFEGKSRRHENPRRMAPLPQGRLAITDEQDERAAYENGFA
jgi:cytoskeletal protein CcmA (bactofilin family)